MSLAGFEIREVATVGKKRTHLAPSVCPIVRWICRNEFCLEALANNVETCVSHPAGSATTVYTNLLQNWDLGWLIRSEAPTTTTIWRRYECQCVGTYFASERPIWEFPVESALHDRLLAHMRTRKYGKELIFIPNNIKIIRKNAEICQLCARSHRGSKRISMPNGTGGGTVHKAFDCRSQANAVGFALGRVGGLDSISSRLEKWKVWFSGLDWIRLDAANACAWEIWFRMSIKIRIGIRCAGRWGDTGQSVPIVVKRRWLYLADLEWNWRWWGKIDKLSSAWLNYFSDWFERSFVVVIVMLDIVIPLIQWSIFVCVFIFYFWVHNSNQNSYYYENFSCYLAIRWCQ